MHKFTFHTTELFLRLTFSSSSTFLKANGVVVAVSSGESSRSSSPDKRASESSGKLSGLLLLLTTLWYRTARFRPRLGFFMRKLSVTQNIKTFRKRLKIQMRNMFKKNFKYIKITDIDKERYHQ